MWKDDAIDKHITAIAQILIDNSPEQFDHIEFFGIVIPGMNGTTASIFFEDGKKISPSNFFDISSDLEYELIKFHAIFVLHSENWKAI